MDTLPRLKQGVLRKFLYILACCWGLVTPAFARDGGALRYVDMNGQIVLQLRSEISPSTKADNYVLITHQNQNSIALTR
ncbi:MAG TPA: hypothetical protein ENJ42_02785, partial [Hellea balneolensis]|nr:hypothetical protein [Hellea balneolensis]